MGQSITSENNPPTSSLPGAEAENPKVLSWWFDTKRSTKLFVSDVPPVMDNQLTQHLNDTIIFWIHGLNSHSRDDENLIASELLSQRGFRVISCDLAGFGRSATDAERGWIGDWHWWLNDTIELIEYVMTSKYPQANHFFVTGVSLGGALTIRICIELQKVLKEPLLSKWEGAGLICPAIEQTLDPSPVEMFALEIANSLGGDKLAWGPLDPMPLERFTQKSNDPYYYSGRMKLGLGFEARKFLLELNEQLNDVGFPFVVFHGEIDDICPITGSELLMALSRTEEKSKLFYRIPNANHALIDTPEDCKNIIEKLSHWYIQRIEHNPTVINNQKK